MQCVEALLCGLEWTEVVVDITPVQAGGYTITDWTHYDPLTSSVSSGIADCHGHPEVKRKLYSAYAETDEGELTIPIPWQVSAKSTGGGRARGARESVSL